MTTLRITLALIALLIFHSAPGFAFGEIARNAPSGAPNPAAAILQQMKGTPTCLSIPDDAYDGSIGSMTCGTVTNTFSGIVGDVDVLFGINHTFVGDLVIKVRDPTNQRTATVMSRPGLSESVDNGSGCCGNNADISDGGLVTFNDQSGGPSAESMGASGSAVCTADGICTYTSNPGASSTGGLSVFNGLNLNGSGNWTFCVGDASDTDTGELCRAGWNVTPAGTSGASNGVINNAIASTDCVSTIVSFDLNPGTQQTSGGQTYFISVFDDNALEFQTSVNVPFGTSSQQVQFSYPDANIGTGAPGIGLFVGTSMPANNNNNVGFVDPLNVQEETSCGTNSPQVTITFDPNSVPAGQPFSVNWISTNATGFNPCIASLGGPTGWSQTQFRPNSGTETYTIAEPGNYDFAMICESESGLLGDTSAVLTVTEPMNAPTVGLNATPERAGPGSAVILDWTTNISPGGLPCMPTGGAGTTWARTGALPANGRRAVTGPMNSGVVSFALECSTGNQSTTRTASVSIVTINDPPPPPPSTASSVTAAGTTVAGTSKRPSISADGSALTFETTASNVTAVLPGTTTPHNDNNGQMDIFLKLAGNPNAVLCSIDENGPLTIGTSNATLAPDGAGATFESDDGQIRTFEGSLGRTRGITSSAADGTRGNAPSANPSIASGATMVAFDSSASNLVPNDANGGMNDVFAKIPQTGEIVLLSQGVGGAAANGDSRNPAISADGNTVFFETTATNIEGLPGAATASTTAAKGVRPPQICGVTNIGPGAGLGTTRGCVSLSTVDGQPGNGASRNPQMSEGGAFGVFESDASNLVEGDTNGVTDVFWFQWDGREVTGLVRVSTSKNGVQGTSSSTNPSISCDGMAVVFESEASNLDPPDANGQTDAYLKFVQSGQVIRMDSTVNGQEPNGDSGNPVISCDGTVIAYGTDADNAVDNDNNGAPDVVTTPAPQVLDADEPGLVQAVLPPDPANQFCPAGFFRVGVSDGPAEGLSSGIYAVEVKLDEPGTKRLQGGLNFGGLIDQDQVGFAAFNISNAAGEQQSIDIELKGRPTDGSSSLPVRVTVERRADGVIIYNETTTISMAQTFIDTLDVTPGFYVARVATEGAPASAAGGAPEGQFFFKMSTSFIGRPGGSFQGGPVVGGYHAENPFGGLSGYVAFCITTPHTTTVSVMSAPTFGSTGAADLRLELLNQGLELIYSVPGS